jgi:hypothetical protein
LDSQVVSLLYIIMHNVPLLPVCQVHADFLEWRLESILMIDRSRPSVASGTAYAVLGPYTRCFAVSYGTDEAQSAT